MVMVLSNFLSILQYFCIYVMVSFQVSGSDLSSLTCSDKQKVSELFYVVFDSQNFIM